MKLEHLKRCVLCDFLGWHAVNNVYTDFCSGFVHVSAYCIRCKRRCLQDSNGDWFDVEDRATDSRTESR